MIHIVSTRKLPVLNTPISMDAGHESAGWWHDRQYQPAETDRGESAERRHGSTYVYRTHFKSAFICLRNYADQ